jgi:5,6-dimethylbenzimidazole synthase
MITEQNDPDDNHEYSLSIQEKNGLYKAIFSRRDVRSHFLAEKDIPNDVLVRVLNAAHHAPSVGFSQPWNFVLIKDKVIRQKIKELFEKEFQKSILSLDGDTLRQQKYASLKLEGIMESALNICVTYDPTRFGPFVLGRTSMPETGTYSVCCAIQNLWLASRAEGIGVGWVSILSNEDLKKILLILEHVSLIAYLCLGYVTDFADKPDLEKAGWLHRLKLNDVIYYENWGRHTYEKDSRWSDFSNAIDSIEEH